MANFLNEEQVKDLDKKDWNVKPNGCWITLYRDEFKPSIWNEYAKELGFDSTKRVVKVLAFGTSK